MAEEVPRPDYHHMDERVLRQFKADLENNNVKRSYQTFRDTWEGGGQKGQLPGPTLLYIAAEDRRVKESFVSWEEKVKHIKFPPEEQLVGASSGGKQSDNDIF